MGLASYRRSVSETKRAAILKAARENFLKGGYSRAAMADIARDADVSTATLYKHFSSKDALFTAIVQEAYSGTEGSLRADITGLSAREVLRNIAQAYMHQQFEGQMNALLRIVIAEVPSAPQLAHEAYRNGVLARYEQICQVVEALIARGDIKPHNVPDGARHLGGMVKEFVVWPALFTPDFEKPDDIDAKVDACIDAYLKIYGTAVPAGRRQEKEIGT